MQEEQQPTAKKSQDMGRERVGVGSQMSDEEALAEARKFETFKPKTLKLRPPNPNCSIHRTVLTITSALTAALNPKP